MQNRGILRDTTRAEGAELGGNVVMQAKRKSEEFRLRRETSRMYDLGATTEL